MIRKLLDAGESISQRGAWVSGTLLLATSVLIAIEVILRKFFSISLGGADEISGYAMAASCSWAFAYALFKKAHIRIDVLYVKFPEKVRYFLDIASMALFGFYMAVLSYFAFYVFLTSLSRDSTANTPLHTPLWIPQLIWACGLILFTLAIFLILFSALSFLLKGDKEATRRLIGATTLDEEIADSTEGGTDTQDAPTGGVA